MPEDGCGAHFIVIGGIVRLEHYSLFEGVTRFGDEVEIKTNEAKRIVNASILRIKIARVTQVAERSGIVFLLVRDSRKFKQQGDRKLSAGCQPFQSGASIREPARGLIGEAE